MNKQETSRLVILAMANWPNMQDKNIRIEITVALWHKMLGHLPFDIVEAGLAKVLVGAKFFPTVSELIEAVDSLRLQSAGLPSQDEAWHEVCKNLDPYSVPVWSHEAIHEIVKQLGGIRALCECDNMSPVRAHFFKLYDLIQKREKEQAVNEKVAMLIKNASLKYIS